MSSKKERRRAKRRADKNIERSWTAVEENNLQLAERLVLRALASGPANALYWKVRAEIALLRGEPDGAVAAAQQAVALSATYLEGHLVHGQALLRCGSPMGARVAFERAATLAPDDPRVVDGLASTSAAAPAQQSQDAQARQSGERRERATSEPEFTQRTARYDWERMAEQLTSCGLCRLPALLSEDECMRFRGWFEQDELFEHEVALGSQGGLVCYRFFKPPLPSEIVELRAELYARLAVVANDWNVLLRREARWPTAHSDFLEHCREQGQARQSVILLDYKRGGRNEYHRDVVGRVCFPLQCAVSLGPAGSEDGGELALIDERAGRKKRERRLATAAGDAVVFCSQARLVRIGGLYGLQAVRHGVTEVTAERRLALGMPFQPYVGR